MNVLCYDCGVCINLVCMFTSRRPSNKKQSTLEDFVTKVPRPGSGGDTCTLGNTATDNSTNKKGRSRETSRSPTVVQDGRPYNMVARGESMSTVSIAPVESSIADSDVVVRYLIQ